MSKVFVKGFDFGTGEEVLSKHFSAVGPIKELFFQSRDAAVVTYEKESDATKAIETLQESTIEGQTRYILVKLDDPDREKGEGKGREKGEGKGKGKGKSSKKGSGENITNAPDRTVFVNGFDFGTDEAALKRHFVKPGAIETLYFQSAGSACITYVKPVDAQRAVDDLDGSTMVGQSRYVAVKLDDPDRPSKGKGSSKGDEKGSGKKGKGSSKGGKGGGAGKGRAVFVSGFDFNTDETALWGHFGKVGEIETLHFQSTGSAVITFETTSAAQRALSELDGTTMSGQSRYVACKLDDPDREGGGKGKGKGSGKSWGKGKY